VPVGLADRRRVQDTAPAGRPSQLPRPAVLSRMATS